MHRLNALAPLIDSVDPQARLATVRMWFSRGYLHYTEEDQAPAGSGSVGMLSRFRCIQVAIACQLADLGVPPKEAAAAALAFSDVSGSPRLPGSLYRTGQTILAVWRDEDGQYRRRVINPTSKDPLGRIRLMLGGTQPVRGALILVDCGEVIRTLEPLLGSPPASSVEF